MATKIIRINDYVIVPYKGTTMNGPISRMTVTDYDLGLIMNRPDAKPPMHIYAICPKDKNKLVHLTRENYKMTNEELFPEYYGMVPEKKIDNPRAEFESKLFKEKIAEEIAQAEESAPVVEDAVETETAEDNKIEAPVVTEERKEEPVEQPSVATEIPELETPVEEEEVIVVSGTTTVEEDENPEDIIEVVNTTIEEAKVETASTNNNTNKNNYNKNKKKKNR